MRNIKAVDFSWLRAAALHGSNVIACPDFFGAQYPLERVLPGVRLLVGSGGSVVLYSRHSLVFRRISVEPLRRTLRIAGAFVAAISSLVFQYPSQKGFYQEIQMARSEHLD